MSNEKEALQRWACQQGMHVSADIAVRWTLEQYEAWCVAWPMGVIVVKLERER